MLFEARERSHSILWVVRDERGVDFIRLLFVYNDAMERCGITSGINWLFVDLNAYFAPVEQELRPELRGRPVGVVPVEADTTCCIAVSYQAKCYGLKGGIGVAKAKALCPHLVLVKARPRLYIEYHEKIKAAIERCVPNPAGDVVR